MSGNVIAKLFDLTEVVIENLNMDNSEDKEIVLSLLTCIKSASHRQKKRSVWVKEWRKDRVERGTFSFLMNELLDDKASFFNYIRMKPETFYFILSQIEKDIKKQDTLMRKAITPEEKLAVTLRYLATGESFKSTNFQTRLSSSFLCDAIPEVCEAIWKHFKDKFLKLPATKKEWEDISDNFETKWQFPHCLGALDIKHVDFRSLRKDGPIFSNYKGTNSIVLLALVDAEYRFIYIDVGCRGGINDAGVLAQSDLKNIIDNAEEYFPADKVIEIGRKLPYVIIADNGFPLQKHIMKPYSHNTSKKRRKVFNVRLERARHVANRAFGILSNRFRIFQQKILLSVEKVELITKTCCVLHNLLSYKDEDYLNEVSPAETEVTPSFSIGDNIIEKAAQCVRQSFEEYFINQGNLYSPDKKL